MSSLREELQSIYDQNGHLTASLVVDQARPKDHPLHDRFEWDDSVAGERWRREQARLLIRSVKVTYKEAGIRKPEVLGRAFHAIPPESEDDQLEDGESREYDFYSAEDVAASPVMTAVLLAAMEREWKALKARYAHFAEFAAMIEGDDLAA